MKAKYWMPIVIIILFGGCKSREYGSEQLLFSPSIKERVVLDNVFVSSWGTIVKDIDGNLYLIIEGVNSIRCYSLEDENDSIKLKFLWKREGLSLVSYVNNVDSASRTNYIAALISANPIKRMKDGDTTFKVKVYSLSLKTGKIVDSTFYISTNGRMPIEKPWLYGKWLFIPDRNPITRVKLPSKYVLFHLDEHGKFTKRLDVPFGAPITRVAIIRDKYALVSTGLFYNLVPVRTSGVSDWFTGVFLISLDNGKILDHLVLQSGTYGSSFLRPTSSDSEWVVYNRCYFCERCGATVYKVKLVPLRVAASISFDEGVAVGWPFRFEGRLLYPTFLINSKKLVLLDENLRIFKEIPCPDCEYDSLYVMHYTSLKTRKGTNAYVYPLRVTGEKYPAIVVVSDKTGQIVRDPSYATGRDVKGRFQNVPEVFVYLPPYDKLNYKNVLLKKGHIPGWVPEIKDRLIVFSTSQHNKVVLRELRLFGESKGREGK